MIKTQHTYDLNKIYDGDDYNIIIEHKSDGYIIIQALKCMGYHGSGDWISIKDLSFFKHTTLSIWISPNTKIYIKRNVGLNSTRNVCNINHFHRNIRENIFKFVMIEKINI